MLESYFRHARHGACGGQGSIMRHKDRPSREGPQVLQVEWKIRGRQLLVT